MVDHSDFELLDAVRYVLQDGDAHDEEAELDLFVLGLELLLGCF